MPVDTVHHFSLCPINLEMPPDVCMMLESNEGKMGPELKEVESSSAGTGLETLGQQCPPNKGTWETGRTTADGFLTVGVGSNQGGDISSPTTEHVDTQAVRTTANITFLQRGHKPRDKEKGSEGKKELTSRWKLREGTASEHGCNFTFLFLWRALGHRRLVARASCFFCLFVFFCSVL